MCKDRHCVIARTFKLTEEQLRELGLINDKSSLIKPNSFSQHRLSFVFIACNACYSYDAVQMADIEASAHPQFGYECSHEPVRLTDR